MTGPSVRLAEVVLPCTDLDAALPFYVERLGFRLDAIFPADAPTTAILSGHGVRLRLTPRDDLGPGLLRLTCEDGTRPRELTAPNGTRVLLAAAGEAALPPLVTALEISRMAAADAWTSGRAGMRYRDLVPGRLGGRFIASHIRLVDGGEVADYVHYHDVRFQAIYGYRGWVRVVYEDQGPEFVMRAGDCVLQPPGIRHRVLESSAGAEVIEIGSPAEHMTCVDHDLRLPTATPAPERDFGGQRFVRHRAAAASWGEWRVPGFEARDTGIAAATDGLAGVRVARLRGATAPLPWTHRGELLFLFVLRGELTLSVEGAGDNPLATGDAVSIPPGRIHAFERCSPDLELLEVTLPARLL